jgi:hypothetical protein
MHLPDNTANPTSMDWTATNSVDGWEPTYNP